ncbi:hypothetical protein HYT56_05170 [Candidatus Woesearchaeota archaeon]|nr:hypothetical protein [Candidatus Woesearchaeota archaeon]
MVYTIKRREPARSEATLSYFREKEVVDQDIFLEFCNYLKIELTRNNGVYESDLSNYQYERLRTSVLVEKVEFKTD